MCLEKAKAHIWVFASELSAWDDLGTELALGLAKKTSIVTLNDFRPTDSQHQLFQMGGFIMYYNHEHRGRQLPQQTFQIEV
jgi:NAD(P)H-nitrite reductase large subunit